MHISTFLVALLPALSGILASNIYQGAAHDHVRRYLDHYDDSHIDARGFADTPIADYGEVMARSLQAELVARDDAELVARDDAELFELVARADAELVARAAARAAAFDDAMALERRAGSHWKCTRKGCDGISDGVPTGPCRFTSKAGHTQCGNTEFKQVGKNGKFTGQIWKNGKVTT